MKKIVVAAVYQFVLGIGLLTAQLNVGSVSAPDASAMLQVSSTTKGFRPPQVSLAATTSFGLTAPTIAAGAKGMMVYNSNTSITGTAAYPAYGAGIYSWDGSGWNPIYYTSPVVLVGKGNASAAVANNVLTSPLNLSTVPINKDGVTVTGSNTINVITAGVYKITICCQAQLQAANTTNNAVLSCHAYKNGTGIDDAYAVQTAMSRANSGAGINYDITSSFIVVLAAGDNISFKGSTLGEPAGVTTTFQITSLYIQRLR